jgi:hypothetical protein
MTEEASQEDPSKTEMSSKESLQQSSPLGMDCERAITFITNHIQTHNIEGVNISTLSNLSNSAFLDKLSEMMLNPVLTECIGIAFYPLLSALVGRWAVFGEAGVEAIACALGRLIYLEARLKRYHKAPSILIADTHKKFCLRGRHS